MPYYDIVRIKAEESDEEEEEEKEVEYDHLSPFMPPLIGEQPLTKDQALDVRDKCLRALKERLIERANIIQVMWCLPQPEYPYALGGGMFLDIGLHFLWA